MLMAKIVTKVVAVAAPAVAEQVHLTVVKTIVAVSVEIRFPAAQAELLTY